MQHKWLLQRHHGSVLLPASPYWCGLPWQFWRQFANHSCLVPSHIFFLHFSPKCCYFYIYSNMSISYLVFACSSINLLCALGPSLSFDPCHINEQVAWAIENYKIVIDKFCIVAKLSTLHIGCARCSL